MTLKFYLPNFEDMVDPDYDFDGDQPSPKRKDRWEHDKFAHQFFPDEQIFDGMLISKASLSPAAEERIRQTGGVHTFTRLKRDIPIMGDCGAFTYILEEKPVYTIQQVLEYYRDFGFDYGVSLDHLAFITVEMLEKAFEKGKIKEKWWKGKTTDQLRRDRFELTLQNAQEFWDLHVREAPDFTPIGIAQGGTPELYYKAVKRLIEIGYEYIALGGLIKSKDKDIIAILEKIHPLIKDGVKLHIFGVARLSLIPHFLRLGVASADSAAPLRRAFLGTGEDNYWTADSQKYAAIRVPQVKGRQGKRGVDSVKEVLKRNGRLSAESLQELEQQALETLRAYHRDAINLDETLRTVLDYDKLYGIERDYTEAYQRTLADKPWQRCGCPICEKIGVDVIIFRGNNRNRRRGFHNVKVFYDQFRQIVKNPAEPEAQVTQQLQLGL